eukprot:913395-Prorocentrum_minimum.AAC.2
MASTSKYPTVVWMGRRGTSSPATWRNKARRITSATGSNGAKSKDTPEPIRKRPTPLKHYPQLAYGPTTPCRVSLITTSYAFPQRAGVIQSIPG